MIVITLFSYFNNEKLYLLYQISVTSTKYSNEILFHHSLNVYFANEVDGETLP